MAHNNIYFFSEAEHSSVSACKSSICVQNLRFCKGFVRNACKSRGHFVTSQILQNLRFCTHSFALQNPPRLHSEAVQGVGFVRSRSPNYVRLQTLGAVANLRFAAASLAQLRFTKPAAAAQRSCARRRFCTQPCTAYGCAATCTAKLCNGSKS